MKKIFALLLSLTMILVVVTGCDSSGHDGEAKTPSGSSVQKGRNYQSVAEDFKSHGFTNINLEELDDLVIGWFTKEGEVESVSVDGDTGYSADTWYPNNVEVVIIYHTFPNENEYTKPTRETESEEVYPSITDSVEEILTVENCESFASILKIKTESDPAYSEFAKTYRNRIVEFNGCIIYLTNHNDYNTRYDILISAGDYIDENTANSGPIFKLEDVGIYDLGINDLYLPDYVSVGSNIKIRAEVEEFNANTGVFELDPISMASR